MPLERSGVPKGPAALLRAARQAFEADPLRAALATAAALRLLAAFASPGFAFQDDHYEVVEVAQNWVDGAREWLGQTGSWRSLVYPGVHYLLFRGLEALGIDDPQAKMLVVRLLHAAWSLGSVLYGVRIAEALGGARAARLSGLLLAGFWLFPFTVVRNLAEVVCQPPLLAGLWYAVRGQGGGRARDLWGAGLWFGLAFALRFQTAIVPASLWLVLVAERRPGQALALLGGFGLCAALLQGGSDYLGYGRPFSSVLSYLAFNSNPANIAQFPRGPFYQYLGTLLGLLIPPTSALLLFGFLRTAREAPRVFWPTLVFLALHSAYPGKQERFLLPVLPPLLVLAAVGTPPLATAWGVLRRNPRAFRALWTWFAGVNLLLLALFTTDPSKRALVAPLTFLRGRGDLHGLVVDKTEGGPPYVPRFYLGRPVPVVLLAAGQDPETIASSLSSAPGANYAIIEGDSHLEDRVNRLRPFLGELEPVASFEPGLVDRALTRLNPRFIVNLTAHVYRAIDAPEGAPARPGRPGPGPG